MYKRILLIAIPIAIAFGLLSWRSQRRRAYEAALWAAATDPLH